MMRTYKSCSPPLTSEVISTLSLSGGRHNGLTNRKNTYAVARPLQAFVNEALCAELRQGPRGCGPHGPLVTPYGSPQERLTGLTGLAARGILPVLWAWLEGDVLTMPYKTMVYHFKTP